MSVREEPTEDREPPEIEDLDSANESIIFVEVGNSNGYIKIDSSSVVDVTR